MIAPIPPSEDARLRALRDCRVLDTPAEDDFDDITRLAAHLCGTPIAAISLIDAERQWVKSSAGATASETLRDVAFCAYTILQPSLLVVPDVREDARFADNPFVTAPAGIRFYAGAPLATEDSHARAIRPAVTAQTLPLLWEDVGGPGRAAGAHRRAPGEARGRGGAGAGGENEGDEVAEAAIKAVERYNHPMEHQAIERLLVKAAKEARALYPHRKGEDGKDWLHTLLLAADLVAAVEEAEDPDEEGQTPRTG